MSKREGPRPPRPEGAKPRNSEKKAKAPSLRDLTKRQPTSAEQDAVYLAFQTGPPIVTAMLGQALVEHHLDALLRLKLKLTDAQWDDTTKDRGPFATFYAKIVMGRVLGLYDDVARDHLDRIRGIRNAFAHAKVLVGFEDASIISELRGAMLPAKPHSDLCKSIKRVRSSKTKPQEAYRELCYAAFMLIVRSEIRSLKSSNRNKARAYLQRTRKNPFAVNLFSQSLVRPGALMLSSPENRTADPTREAQQLDEAIRAFGGESDGEK